MHRYLTAIFLPCLLFAGTANAASRPNIVLIMADDLGYECIEANGGTSYRTPVLNELAKTGVRFEHCYSQPICTPSRVKLMTGLSNKRNYAQFGWLEKSQTTFANILRDAGYATAIAGKWQLGADEDGPKHFGFDRYCLWHLLSRKSRYATPGFDIDGKSALHPKRYGPDIATDFACDFIDRNHDRPFLLYYPMILTHCPFEPTPKSAAWDPNSKGSPTYKGKPKFFGDMVSYMDHCVGRILSQLERSDVAQNTLVIFTGDNGTDRPIVSKMGSRLIAGAKGEMTDGGTRVPLIVRWPGKTVAGHISDALVDFSDFLPTMLTAANIDQPASMQLDGLSFLAELTGQQQKKREWIYMWYARNGGAEGREFARNQRYKLYRNGSFFNITDDELEQSPLLTKSLTNEQQTVRKQLQAVLDQYKNARPKKFAQWKPLDKRSLRGR